MKIMRKKIPYGGSGLKSLKVGNETSKFEEAKIEYQGQRNEKGRGRQD